MADIQEDDMTQATAYESDDFIRIVKNRGTVPVSQIIGRTYIKTYLDTLYEPIGGGGTGWQTVTETWTRTGNHTFTVATDLTTKYGKGTKVRYKDGGSYEYGVIGAATYSSPNTTVTLITNTDYAMAAGTITDTAISYQATPQGFPGWFNWEPSPTGYSAAPTYIARWSTQGRAITVVHTLITGGTSNATTLTHGAPVVAVTITNMVWRAVLAQVFDNGASATTPGRCAISSASSTISLFTNMASGAWTAANGKGVIYQLTYEF